MNNRIYLTPQDDFQPMRMVPISGNLSTRSQDPVERWTPFQPGAGPTPALMRAREEVVRKEQEQAKNTQQAVAFGGALLLGMLIAWLAFSKPAPVYVIIPPT